MLFGFKQALVNNRKKKKCNFRKVKVTFIVVHKILKNLFTYKNSKIIKAERIYIYQLQ